MVDDEDNTVRHRIIKEDLEEKGLNEEQADLLAEGTVLFEDAMKRTMAYIIFHQLWSLK